MSAVDPHEAGVTRIVAVRHGETVWNAEMRMQGQLDTALSARGRWQARRAGESLATEAFDAVFASDLARAFDTARAIVERVNPERAKNDAAPLAIVTDTGLRERSFGVFQGSTYAEIDARWPLEAPRWRNHEPDFGPEGGETFRDFSARAVAAVAGIAEGQRGRSILIVTHGGVLDCLYRAASRIDLGAARSWALGNAAINRLLHTAQGFSLVGWSDTSHLDGATLDDGSEGEAAAAVTPR